MAAQFDSISMRTVSAAATPPVVELTSLRTLTSNQEHELRALREALRFLGFSPEKVALARDLPGGGLWLRHALQSAEVRFSLERARSDQAMVAPVAVATAQSWFDEVRSTPPSWSFAARERRRA
jgi:hypothetical protein